MPDFATLAGPPDAHRTRRSTCSGTSGAPRNTIDWTLVQVTGTQGADRRGRPARHRGVLRVQIGKRLCDEVGDGVEGGVEHMLQDRS